MPIVDVEPCAVNAYIQNPSSFDGNMLATNIYSTKVIYIDYFFCVDQQSLFYILPESSTVCNLLLVRVLAYPSHTNRLRGIKSLMANIPCKVLPFSTIQSLWTCVPAIRSIVIRSDVCGRTTTLGTSYIWIVWLLSSSALNKRMFCNVPLSAPLSNPRFDKVFWKKVKVWS